MKRVSPLELRDDAATEKPKKSPESRMPPNPPAVSLVFCSACA